MALAATTTTETVDLIDDLCSRKEGWSTIVPIDPQAAVHAPSESKNHYSVLPGVPDEVLTHLKHGFHKLFDKPCYNNVALESAVGGIIHDLSFPIIAYRGRGEPKEASVREGLILPILSTIYQHAPMIPTNTSSDLFDVRLVPEDKIELRRSSPGRRPEIDYIISIENSGNGTIIKFILVEVKKKPATQQLQQLASYAGKVGTCEKFQGQTLVSVLIDPEYYCLGFSVYKNTEGQSLPMLYVTRPVPWRHKSEHPLAICKSAIMLLSVLHLIDTPRLILQKVPQEIAEVTRILYDKPYEPIQSVVRHSFSQLAEEVAALKRELQHKDRELEEKIEQIIQIVSPHKHKSAKEGLRTRSMQS